MKLLMSFCYTYNPPIPISLLEISYVTNPARHRYKDIHIGAMNARMKIETISMIPHALFIRNHIVDDTSECLYVYVSPRYLNARLKTSNTLNTHSLYWIWERKRRRERGKEQKKLIMLLVPGCMYNSYIEEMLNAVP